MGVSVSAWCSITGRKHFMLLLWLLGSGVLFWRTYNYFKYDPGFYYVHQILGPWLCISRGSAAVLNLNCGLVLLPMCRFLLAALRRLHRTISLETMRVLLDTCKGFHIACAVLICVHAVIHVVSHMFNARNFSLFYNSAIPTVNGAHSPNEDPMAVVLSTVPGVTGCLMCLVLVMIVTSSVRYMREINYDLFWYTHRLIAIFYILLLVHALRGPIRKQINITSHTPGCNSTLSNMSALPEPFPEPEAEYSFDTHLCIEGPRFDRIGCQSWLWVGVPLLLYVLDGVCRLRQRESRVKVTHIELLESDVLGISMRTDISTAVPGQYVLLQCPAVSTLEWHPYSLTKCATKESPDISVHIRTHGDWSEKLRDHARDLMQQEQRDQFKEQYKDSGTSPRSRDPSLKLLVDGPFGGPLDSVLNCRTCLCVGGGVGITPFISVLNYIRLNGHVKLRTRRLYLLWICKSIGDFACFISVISSTYKQLWSENLPDYLDVRLYCTRFHAGDQEKIPTEFSNFVSTRTTIGRPHWPEVFEQLDDSHRREDVHVFVCGPKSLIHDVKQQCLQNTQHGARFTLHKESF